MNRLENVQQCSALYNCGGNWTTLDKIASNPITNTTPSCQSYTDTHLQLTNTLVVSHLTHSHLKILW